MILLCLFQLVTMAHSLPDLLDDLEQDQKSCSTDQVLEGDEKEVGCCTLMIHPLEKRITAFIQKNKNLTIHYNYL